MSFDLPHGWDCLLPSTLPCTSRHKFTADNKLVPASPFNLYRISSERNGAFAFNILLPLFGMRWLIIHTHCNDFAVSLLYLANLSPTVKLPWQTRRTPSWLTWGTGGGHEAVSRVTRSPASSEMENINLTRIRRRYFCVHGLKRQSWYWALAPWWYTALHCITCNAPPARPHRSCITWPSTRAHLSSRSLQDKHKYCQKNKDSMTLLPNFSLLFQTRIFKHHANKFPKGTKSRWNVRGKHPKLYFDSLSKTSVSR